MEWISALYDGQGNEIKVKPGHVMVFGNESFAQMPVPEYSAEFVYRPPNYEGPIAHDGTIEAGEHHIQIHVPQNLMCEWGTTQKAYFPRSKDA